ncbi:MAG: AAA family ATPase [Bacteroidales bacterium]
MYIHRLRIWNFRKVGTFDNSLAVNTDKPGVDIYFKKGLNVLIGENDSGKTAVVDAIRFVLGTRTFENQRIGLDDFHYYDDKQATELRIECTFRGLNLFQAGQLMEWAYLQDEKCAYELRVWLTALRKDNKVVQNIKAGVDDEGSFMEGNARDLLRVTYLKPLRDASTELSPGYRSRLAQILLSNKVFDKEIDDDGKEKPHPLEVLVGDANEDVKGFFSKKSNEESLGGKEILDVLSRHLSQFLHIKDQRTPYFDISGSKLPSILRKLGLLLEDRESGLGTLNKLFMAAELLQLETENGLKLALIEELEAHLHPQAQLRVIKSLEELGHETQFILTTHSTTLGSSIPLENLTLCYGDTQTQLFSLNKGMTSLEADDYHFLSRFLDATKANLFFARGVIFVEGDAENILLPAIAELIDRPLHRYGVSIVNVQSKAFLRYVKVFRRADSSGTLPIKVAVITDLDIEQEKDESGNIISKKRNDEIPDIAEEREKLVNEFNNEDGHIKVFPSPLWTLEYDLANSELAKYLNQSTLIAQLLKSRSKNKDFQWISDEEKTKRIEKADKLMSETWKSLNQPQIAFKIYSRLKENKASKTVNAQWLASLLLENEAETRALILDAPVVKYIRDAIYHVTEPYIAEDGDN